MLSDKELRYLKILDGGGEYNGKKFPPGGLCYHTIPEGLRSLVDRGYIVLKPALAGPLAVATGETIALISEAGKFVVEHYND